MRLHPSRVSTPMQHGKRSSSEVSKTPLSEHHLHPLHPFPVRNPRTLARAQNPAKFTITPNRSSSCTRVRCRPSISRTRPGASSRPKRTTSSCYTPDYPLLRTPLRRKQILHKAGGKNSSGLAKLSTRTSSTSSARTLSEDATDPPVPLRFVRPPRVPMAPPRRGNGTQRISRCCRYSIWSGRSSSCWKG